MSLTPVSPELLLMLLTDARLPVAGHTQSAGLEPAVLDGLAADRVPEFIATRLASITKVDAASAVVALHTLWGGGLLEQVEWAWSARTPSAAMRRNSRMQGRGLRRLALRLWPEAMNRIGDDAPRPLVLAAIARTYELSPLQLARVVGYDDVQTVASAALKLLPLDPAAVSEWVLDSLPVVDAMAVAVAHLTEPGEIPASGAPQFETWAEAHAVTSRRLFSA